MRNKLEQLNYVQNAMGGGVGAAEAANYTHHPHQYQRNGAAGNLSVQTGSNRIHAARSNEKYPAASGQFAPGSRASTNNPSSGLS